MFEVDVDTSVVWLGTQYEPVCFSREQEERFLNQSGKYCSALKKYAEHEQANSSTKKYSRVTERTGYVLDERFRGKLCSSTTPKTAGGH